jgi:hypothetical protein
LAGDLLLEAVWSAIPELEWETPEGLEKTSGVDEGTLKRIIEFLVRWDFVEVRLSPNLQVRRKAGAISPVEIASSLRIVSEIEKATPSGRVRIATRIACRACGGRTLSFSGPNQVQCAYCYEKQWHAIEIDKTTMKLDTKLPKRPGILEQISARLRLP